MTSVISTNGCAGFVLKRRQRHEAFDGDQKSLGLFDTEQAAIDAILKHSEADLADAAGN
jgi:hypothetical protein